MTHSGTVLLAAPVHPVLTDGLEALGLKQVDHLPRAQQHRVVIERTAPDRNPRQRIDRVVLVHREQAARFRHAPRLDRKRIQ